MRIAVTALAALMLDFPGAAFAQSADHDSHHPTGARPVAVPGALAEGEVRKVDKDAKKITIRHGPIPSLDMPAMSMVFQIRDTALLDQVKAGDKIRFSAERSGGQYVVTRIEPAK